MRKIILMTTAVIFLAACCYPEKTHTANRKAYKRSIKKTDNKKKIDKDTREVDMYRYM